MQDCCRITLGGTLRLRRNLFTACDAIYPRSINVEKVFLTLVLILSTTVHAAGNPGFVVNLTIDQDGAKSSKTVTVEAGVVGALTLVDHGVKKSELGLVVDQASDSTAMLTLELTDVASGKKSESSMEVKLGEMASMDTFTAQKKTRSIEVVVHRMSPADLEHAKSEAGTLICQTDNSATSVASTGGLPILNAGALPQPNSGCCSVRCAGSPETYLTCCNVVRCCDCGGCCSPGSGCPGGPCP